MMGSWENICNLAGMWSSRHGLFKDYSQSTTSLNLNAFCATAHVLNLIGLNSSLAL